LETDEAIFARVRDLAPGAAGLADPEYIAGLRAAVAAALEYVLVGIELGDDQSPPTQGEEWGAQIPAVALEQARRAARTGVGLDTVLRRYVAGLAILEGFVVQEAMDGIPPTRLAGDGLRDVLASMSALVDCLIAAVSRAYGEELERPPHAAPRRRASPGRFVGTRRDLILEAVVEVVAERGVPGASVGLVIARAQVSRRAFYECFASLEDATVAVMDGTLEQLSALASQALAAEESWRDGMRAALAAVLAFFDAHPALARVCVVQALGGGPVVLARREYIVSAFRALVVSSIERQVTPASPLAAEGVMASVMGIVHTHIVTEQSGPLLGLLGPLMGLASSLYLDGGEVQREIERGNELAATMLAQRASRAAPRADGDSRVHVPDALLGSRAHRARLCLLYVAEQNERGLRPSNQQVGEGIGLSHRGQVAGLLGKLAALGLLVKRSEGEGYPNAWSVTPRGDDVARAIVGQ